MYPLKESLKFILFSAPVLLSILPTLFTSKNGKEVRAEANSQIVGGCPVQWTQHSQLKLETLSLVSATAGSFHYH